MQIFFPQHTDKIFHISKNYTIYQLDSFWKMTKIKDALSNSPQIIEVDQRPSRDFVMKFHTDEFTEALFSGKNREKHIESCGVFWQPYLPIHAFNKAYSHYLAIKNLLDGDNLSVVITDGGHHTTPNNAYGFGPINAFGVALNNLTTEISDKRIVILDLDTHMGNGFSFIRGNNIKIFDIWHDRLEKWGVDSNPNYLNTEVKNESEWWIALENYMQEIVEFEPHIVLYYSGADVLETCPKGGIKGFTKKDFEEREKVVFKILAENEIPALLSVGGGYVDYKSGDVTNERQSLIDQHVLSIETAKKYIGQS